MVSATVTPTATATPIPGKKDAELEVQGGGEEFKQPPDAAVLDVDDAAGRGRCHGGCRGRRVRGGRRHRPGQGCR